MASLRQAETPRPQTPDLRGTEVAITGRLASMRRDEAIERIRSAGGSYATTPTETTGVLVVGQGGPPLEQDGRPTKHLRRARELREAGVPIRIVAEGELLSLLALEERREDLSRLYTTEQLARILDVPRRELTSWVRAGLIEPVKVVRRLAFFDYRQVAALQAIRALAQDGIRPQRIRKSLLELEGWWPDTESALAQLTTVEEESTLFVRTDSGTLAEPSGQGLFDFGAEPEPQPVELPPVEEDGQGEEFWFRHGLSLEARGRPEEAIVAYAKALESGKPRPELAFNLGNLMYAVGKKEEAAQCFALATEIEPEYVEAWNNLGNALADLGRADEALAAFARALATEPDYPDPHYNRAETLAALGRLDEAREHWRAYLASDPHSTWADEVRARLRRTE